jgi:hypothetical protein
MTTHKRDLWLPSASSAVRSLNCPGSVVLPRTRTEATPEMQRGSYLHSYLEHLLTGKQSILDRMVSVYGDSEDFDGVQETCTKINRNDILRGGEFVSAEEAFTYNPGTDSARSLGCSIEREYLQHGWKPTTEIAGTADVILRTPTGLLVGDFKTGHFDNQVSYSWGPQLDMLGLMAARYYGEDSVTVAICLVMDDGRLVWTESRHLDALALDAIAGTVSAAVSEWHRTAQAVAQGQTPTTKQGPWCDYCPSRSQCPAWFVLAREFASGARKLTTSEDLTPEVAGLAWERLQQLMTLAADVNELLRGYAKHRPFVMPNGSRLGLVERSREELDGAKAVDFIRRSFSQAKADEVSKIKITKTALEKTFGPVQAKEILASLRKAGAVKSSKFYVLEEIKGGK